MNQAAPILDPWELVWGQPYIDSQTLAAAIEQDLERNAQPDFRTRLLVRDAAVALRSFWGRQRFARWLEASSVGRHVRAILQEKLGQTGFHAIEKRLVDRIDPRLVCQVFDLLGRGIHNPVEVHVTGSIPTTIKGLTARPTSEIEIVDKVPYEIRRQQGILRQIQIQFGLILVKAWPQGLPTRWLDRRQSLGSFGGLRVYLVDEYDIFVSKLSSQYEPYQLDLRVLAFKLDGDKAKHRLLTDGRALLDDPELRPQIEENWRFIFQEPLFAERPEKRAGADKQADLKQKGPVPKRGRPKRSGSTGQDKKGTNRPLEPDG